MESPRLTSQQYDWLAERIGREVRLLARLQTRLRQRGFNLYDPLYVATIQAYNAVHTLSIHIHSARSRAGVPGNLSIAGQAVAGSAMRPNTPARLQ